MCFSEAECISRIQQMEACFDRLQEELAMEPPRVDRKLLQQLTDYYEGGQWLRDFERDEQGLLPPTLKRGVLSEDGVDSLLARISQEETVCLE